MIPEDPDVNTLGANLGQLIRDWLPVVLLLVSGLVWGMKLEARYDQMLSERNADREKLAALERQVSAGILPITHERITSLQREIERLQADVQLCIDATENRTR